MMFPSVLWKQTVKFAYEIRIEENRLKIVIFSDFNRFFNRLIDFFDRSIKIDKSIFLIERKTMFIKDPPPGGPRELTQKLS